MKLIAYSCGYWTVEASGELYRVFGPLVDAGYEYEIGSRWYPATDPRVIARKNQETLMKSPAYSCVNGGCVNPARLSGPVSRPKPSEPPTIGHQL